ncbi:MAG: RNase J family beta-CASP ribonuclease [Nanoarchaeota archaeon]|nr:RNase J family beta-CASP ribonuclease [Nanoarchaeota archaeon]
MAIEICTVGGYSEVGKNMLAVKVDDEVIVLDIGLNLDPYIKYTDDEEVHDMSAVALTKIGAIPDISMIEDWRKQVVAVIPTHAHLDHVGAVPYLSNRFNAPILCTPFTAAVLKAICNNEKIKLKNPVKQLNVNSTHKVSDNITIEFINMCHSTPQTVAVVLHTRYGNIVYATDFKFDNHPVLGKKTNSRRLKEIGKAGVLCLICDSLRARVESKTPSEIVAKEMLKDVMLGTETEGKSIIVTTFSSHLARLKSIIEFGQGLKRKIVFLGRSLAKYVEAGEEVGIIKFSKEVEICKYRKHIKRKLKKISTEKDKYLIVCTGHQGEPKAVLSAIVRGDFDYKLSKEDNLVFSCTVIPNALNIANRELLERELKQQGVRIFKDIHVSGHPGREDLRDMVNMLKPQHVIPCHGDISFASGLSALLDEMGFKLGEQVHIMSDGQRLKLS